MAEHKLNEQWVEELDGKKHMLGRQVDLCKMLCTTAMWPGLL